jgi:hypothetical protein
MSKNPGFHAILMDGELHLSVDNSKKVLAVARAFANTVLDMGLLADSKTDRYHVIVDAELLSDGRISLNFELSYAGDYT